MEITNIGLYPIKLKQDLDLLEEEEDLLELDDYQKIIDVETVHESKDTLGSTIDTFI